MEYKPRLTGCAIAAMSFLAVAEKASGQTWTGAGANTLFNNPANWSAGVPGPLDTARFSEVGGRVTLSSDVLNEELRIGPIKVTAELAGFTWSLGGSFQPVLVSSPQQATLILENGMMAARGVVVGASTDDRGRLWIADDAVLQVADKLTVANRGGATASIFGKVTAESVDAGFATGSDGRILVSGAAARLDVTGTFHLGYRGFGGIWADNGARVETDFMLAGSFGNCAIHADNGAEIRATDISFASRGLGNLSVAGQATVRAHGMIVASGGDSVVNMNVTGAGSSLMLTGFLDAGRGVTVLEISDGGRGWVGPGPVAWPPPSGPVMNWGDFGAKASGTVRGTGSLLTVFGTMVIGASAAETVTIGHWQIREGASGAANDLILGRHGAAGVLEVLGNESHFATRSLTVGNSAQPDAFGNIPPTYGRAGIRISAGATLRINNEGPTRVYEGASTLILADGEIVASEWCLDTARLIGTGEVNGDLRNNAGRLTPGTLSFSGAFPEIIADGSLFESSLFPANLAPGELKISGNYRQNNDGTLVLLLGGFNPYEYGRLSVGGSIELGGNLHIEAVNGFQAELGDVFHFLSYDRDTERAGGFETITWGDGFDGLAFEIVYQDGFGGVTVYLVSSPYLSFESWTELIGLPADKQGPLDRNGPLQIQNLLAYALGIDPHTAEPGDLPSLQRDPADPDVLVFTYSRSKSATGVSYQIISSQDLLLWDDAPLLSHGMIGEDEFHEHWEATIAAVGEDPIFIRLHVEQQ